MPNLEIQTGKIATGLTWSWRYGGGGGGSGGSGGSGGGGGCNIGV